ncbi:MAG: hypothetical protein FE78DRAFT_73945 [Acidomyces sp. 'richmondensis']|nr:MAG: hypothetical protein FE78DRAFT_73945 [Acidomyces sp. 'richmondensis']
MAGQTLAISGWQLEILFDKSFPSATATTNDTGEPSRLVDSRVSHRDSSAVQSGPMSVLSYYARRRRVDPCLLYTSKLPTAVYLMTDNSAEQTRRTTDWPGIVHIHDAMAKRFKFEPRDSKPNKSLGHFFACLAANLSYGPRALRRTLCTSRYRENLKWLFHCT